MVLDYYPMDIDRTYEFIWDVAGYNDNISVQETIEELLDDRFCRHILPRGKNKGEMCMKRFRKIKCINNNIYNKYCSEHRYIHTECAVQDCNKHRKKGSNVCFKHFRMKTKIETLDEYYSYNNHYESIYNFREYKNYINKIKIRNDFSWPKNYFDHESIKINYNSNPVIKYKKFSLLSFLECIYERFKKNIYNFINKYKINIKVLYYLIYLVKTIKEKTFIKDVILYENNNTNTIFYNDIYLYIKNVKYDNFYKYLYKIYNTNYKYIFKIIFKTYKNHKKPNDYFINVKDIDINRPYNPKRICYSPLKQTPEQRKEKKRIQKFNLKYNKLLKINKEMMNFIDNNLKTDFCKAKIKEIIYEYMYLLDKRIKNGNNDINIIRDTYKGLYSELCNSWYFFYPDDEDENHDNKIVNDINTWKKYGIH
jgi:hypothetical protein